MGPRERAGPCWPPVPGSSRVPASQALPRAQHLPTGLQPPFLAQDPLPVLPHLPGLELLSGAVPRPPTAVASPCLPPAGRLSSPGIPVAPAAHLRLTGRAGLLSAPRSQSALGVRLQAFWGPSPRGFSLRRAAAQGSQRRPPAAEQQRGGRWGRCRPQRCPSRRVRARALYPRKGTIAFVTFSKAAVPLRCWAVTEEAGDAGCEQRAPRATPAPANPSKDSFHQKPRRHEALPSSGSVQGPSLSSAPAPLAPGAEAGCAGSSGLLSLWTGHHPSRSPAADQPKHHRPGSAAGAARPPQTGLGTVTSPQ